MLYLSRPQLTPSPETQRALHATDGYLVLAMPREALAELDAIAPQERELAPVQLARIRVLLHLRRWKAAEKLSRHGAARHPDEQEFTVQCAFSLHQMQQAAKAVAVLQSAPEWVRRTGILHYNLACYEARLGDLAAARECIDAAIELNAAMKKNARVDPDLAALWN